jgi:hypothetical protein
MRRIVLVAVALCLATAPAFANTAHPAASDKPVTALAPSIPLALALGQEIPKKVDVDIDVGDRGGAWWRSPWVIGIGVLIVVLLIVMASRPSGGTTIVERRE